MRTVYFILFVLFLGSCGNKNQLFSKKYYGEYQGVQEAYNVHVGNETVLVPAAEYTLSFNNEKLLLVTPKQNLLGKYTLKADTKMYYALTVKLENGIVEEWQLWKKGKRLIRKPLRPQPDVIFVKK